MNKRPDTHRMVTYHNRDIKFLAYRKKIVDIITHLKKSISLVFR